MQIPIIRASRCALQHISRMRSGTVHSVYRRTINLALTPDDKDTVTGAGRDTGANSPQLLALQDRDCVLSPLSLCTARSAGQLSALPIEEGQTVLAEPDGILIVTPDGMIDFEFADSAATVDLDLTVHPALPLTDRKLCALAACIDRAVPSAPADSFIRIFSDETLTDHLILHTARSCVSKAAAYLRTGKTASAAETLCGGLIGLGTGLTPGGDDFLCGLFAGLCLRGVFPDPDIHAALPPDPPVPAEASPAASFGSADCLRAFGRTLRDETLDHLSDTDDISAAFLRCACEGQFSEAVIRLAADAAAGTCGRESVAELFSQIGHTSGFDTLAGIYFTLSPDFATL